MHQYRCPFLSQALGDDLPGAAVRAGDKGNAVTQVEVHESPGVVESITIMPPLMLALATLVCVVLIGSYVQSVAGFAMGLLIVAAAASAQLYDLEVTAAVVSFLSLVNIGLSLHGHYHLVHGRMLKWLVIGQLPAIVVGVWLLGVLSRQASGLLEMVLGTFLIAGSASMMVRPRLRAAVSGAPAAWVAGTAGGLLGGLFAASGPVIGWFCYRQPLPVAEIRATLLGCFAATTLARIATVGIAGDLTREIGVITVSCLPAVLLGVWMGRKYPPPVTEATLRRLAFALLTLLGLWILGSAVNRL